MITPVEKKVTPIQFGYALNKTQLEDLRQSLTKQDLQRIHDERADTFFDTDGYKYSHYLQYPQDTNFISSYLEARSDKNGPETLFFGLEYMLERYFSHPITVPMVEEMAEDAEAYGVPFNREGWMKIATELGGKIPLEIKAVDEGSVVPTGNVLLQYTNTKPGYHWVAGWFETQLLRLWYPTSVATKSYEAKKVIQEYLEETSDVKDESLRFMLHDFGARGVSSRESAGVGGMAHLLNFVGTDTVMGIRYAQRYYDAGKPGFDFALSIPAAEHSTVTGWRTNDKNEDWEMNAFRNMLKQFGGKYPVIAVVSDSDNYYNALEKWASLKEEIQASGSRLVVRPDSGDPVRVILESLVELDKTFGSTLNSKGFKVLNNVRLIQGDGIDLEDLPIILEATRRLGYSVDNLAFGMGGGLLQKTTRDTHGFAVKTNAIRRQLGDKNPWFAVFKDPKDEYGRSLGKTSKLGRQDLIKVNGKYKTIKASERRKYPTTKYPSQLKTFFKDGVIYKNEKFSTIKKRAQRSLDKSFQKGTGSRLFAPELTPKQELNIANLRQKMSVLGLLTKDQIVGWRV